MAVSRRLRYEILRRDNHACTYCGATAPDAKLTVDHVVPTALGGSDEPSNLTTACADCNGGKSASSPDAATVESVEQDALRWSVAMKQVAAQQLGNLKALNRYQQAVYRMWGEQADVLPSDWTASAERWYAMELDLTEVQYAVDVAIASTHVRRYDMWKYACGVIYKRLRERQEMAVAMLAPEEAGDSCGEEEEDDRQFGLELRKEWLVVASQWAVLAELEGRIIRRVGEFVTAVGVTPYDIWSGAADRGPSVESWVDAALADTWLDKAERNRARMYCARLVQDVFDSMEADIEQSLAECGP